MHIPTPSDSLLRSEKSIFLWNLSPVYFYFYTKEDGHHEDETLADAMLNMIEDIKTEVQKRDMQITEHHFIQHNPNDVPTNLKLTFASKEQAKMFREEDTSTLTGILLAKYKKFDQHIPIRQCKVCWKTDRRVEMPSAPRYSDAPDA